MNAGSILELYTTPVGWLIYDVLWTLIVVTPLILIPFIVIIARNWALSVRSMETRPSVMVALRRSETDVMMAIIVVTLACLPFVPLDLRLLSYEPGQLLTTQDVPEKIDIDNDPSTYNSSLKPKVEEFTTVLGAPTVPIVWALVMRGAAGATHAVVDAIQRSDYQGDIRAAQNALARYALKSQDIGAEVGSFYEQCYKPARAKYLRWAADGSWEDKLPADAKEIAQTNPEDINALGSEIFQGTPGLYRPCDEPTVCGDTLQAPWPITGWPYDANRDVGRGETEQSLPGQPYCHEWWTDENRGIRQKILDDVGSWEQIWLNVKDALGIEDVPEEPDQLAQYFLKNSYRSNKGTDGVYNLGNNWSPFFDRSLLEHVKVGLSVIGSAWEAGKMSIALAVMKEALPMAQAIALMLVYALLGMVMLFTGFRFFGVLVGALAIFAFKFLTAIWAIADYVDVVIQQAVYPELTASELLYKADLLEHFVFTIVAVSGFVGLPLLFFLMLGWAGASVGSAVTASLTGASVGAAGGAAASAGLSAATSAATKGMSKVKGG